MPHNPALSHQISAYVELDLYKRMRRIQRAKPRYTVSYQVQRALEAAIVSIEEQAGLTPLKKNLPS